MVLKTERLTIRQIMEDDWKDIQAILADFQTSEFAQYDFPSSTDDESVRERIARWAKADKTEQIFLVICLNDTVIGYIALRAMEKRYEVGYCFHSAYHRKGYAKESLLVLFDSLRGTGTERFTAGTAINNIPSVALLKALGFRQVGTEKVSFYQDSRGNDIVFDGGIYELTLK